MGGTLIELALTDLDDTLIEFGTSCATQRSRDAIHAVLDEGLRFGPVTGRLPVDMTWMFDGDEACYATGAFSNGQVVSVDGKVERVVTIDHALLEAAECVLDATGGEGYLALYHPWKLGEIAYVTTRPDNLLANPPETYGSITQIVPAVTDFPASNDDPENPGYVKANIQCCCSRDQMVRLRDRLREEVPGLDFVFPSAVAPVIDILPSGWGKGDGVRTLLDLLGLSLDEVVAFGDSENDLAMLEAVTNSVAVANASEQVSRIAAWHIGPCSDGAVDDALLDIARAHREARLPSFMERGAR